jgi:putative mRNA 3-end processing factor
MLDFTFEDNAIKVKGLPLWLDSSNFRSDKSPVRRPLNFVSHAHADHIGRHKRIICTPQTLKLIKTRIKVEEAITLEYGQEMEIAGAKISLHPAGHVLGSAQILIEKDGQRICYTGDFRLGSGLTTEECSPVPCDTLLMECTYGHEKYLFPERQDLLADIEEFIEGCFDRLEFPVILGYSLGKAQEAIKAATDLGYGSVVHPAIYKICRVYKEFGIQFHNLSEIGKRPVGRRVIVFPPNKKVWQGLNPWVRFALPYSQAGQQIAGAQPCMVPTRLYHTATTVILTNWLKQLVSVEPAKSSPTMVMQSGSPTNWKLKDSTLPPWSPLPRQNSFSKVLKKY